MREEWRPAIYDGEVWGNIKKKIITFDIFLLYFNIEDNYVICGRIA